jgi:hypothetical protein
MTTDWLSVTGTVSPRTVPDECRKEVPEERNRRADPEMLLVLEYPSYATTLGLSSYTGFCV